MSIREKLFMAFFAIFGMGHLEACMLIGYSVGHSIDKQTAQTSIYDTVAPSRILGKQVGITAPANHTEILWVDKCTEIAYVDSSNEIVHRTVAKQLPYDSFIPGPSLQPKPIFQLSSTNDIIDQHRYDRIVPAKKPVTGRILGVLTGTVVDVLILRWFLRSVGFHFFPEYDIKFSK